MENNNKTEKLAVRFQDEQLAEHWSVNETPESFSKLMFHLERKTNFKKYFDEAVDHLNLNGDNFGNGLVVADIGAGVCWTSAILAGNPKIKLVYGVEPSVNRMEHAKFVIRHYGAENKVKVINGSFLKPNIPEKVDLVLLCGSLHHCYDDQTGALFSNIKNMLKDNGVILIANEHYVDWIWGLKRLLSYLNHFHERKEKFYYTLGNLLAPYPFDGEHWRTRRELVKMFRDNGFRAVFFVHKGDLCKDKPYLYQRVGWHYYHAVLSCKNRTI